MAGQVHPVAGVEDMCHGATQGCKYLDIWTHKMSRCQPIKMLMGTTRLQTMHHDVLAVIDFC